MISSAADQHQARAVRLVRAQHAVEGDGFVVRRPFPTASLSHIDPFPLFDHMGPSVNPSHATARS